MSYRASHRRKPVTEVPQSGAQPSPFAVGTWARVARRIRVPLGFIFAFVYIWLAQPTKTSLITGTLVLVPGLVLRGLASGHVQKNEQLATSGPYAYTRNPLYLGSLILSCGFALASRSGWVVLGIVGLFFAIYVPVIRSEEAFLRERFPQFEDYTRNVPGLLPRLSRFGNT